MRKDSDSRKYIRVGNLVWGLTYKCASTSMLKALPDPRVYTELRKGDHVRIIVRDPRDRLVSAWKWFSGCHGSYIKDILERAPEDHDNLLNEKTPCEQWIRLALQHWNPHWVPQTEIHRRWREFELVPITSLHTLGWGHEKQTRKDNTWEQYYSDDLLDLVNEVYAEDIEMWKEATDDGIDTGTRRVL